MARLFKILGLASVYMMAAPCTFAEHGFSVIPNGLIPNPFAGLGAIGTSIASALGLAT